MKVLADMSVSLLNQPHLRDQPGRQQKRRDRRRAHAGDQRKAPLRGAVHQHDHGDGKQPHPQARKINLLWM